jgi:hypothetical protein
MYIVQAKSSYSVSNCLLWKEKNVISEIPEFKLYLAKGCKWALDTPPCNASCTNSYPELAWKEKCHFRRTRVQALFGKKDVSKHWT